MKKLILLFIISIFVNQSIAQNWTPLSTPTPRNYYGVWFDDTNPNNGFAVSWYIASFDYIPYAIRTMNGGNGFTPMQTFCAGQDIWFTVPYNGVVVGNGINQTTDGGNTWNIIEDVTAMQAGWLYDVMFTNSTDGYAIGQRYDFSYTNFEGMLYKTTNAGGSWTNTTVTQDINNENTEFHAIYSTGGGIIYAGANGFWPGASTLFKSVDDGVTWSPLSFTADTWSLFFTSADTGFAGTSAGIFRTTDAGASWTNILPTTGAIRTIKFKDGIGFAAGGGGIIYSSSDNGNTWSPMTSPVTTALQDIHIVHHNLAFISGNSGVILKYTNTTGITVYQEPEPFQIWYDAAEGVLITEWDQPLQDPVTIKMYDNSGRLLLNKSVKPAAGTLRFSDPVHTLSAGVYHVTVNTGDHQYTRKIAILQH